MVGIVLEAMGGRIRLLSIMFNLKIEENSLLAFSCN